MDADSGELRWRYETGDAVFSSPAVVDGVVYVGSSDSYLYAVDADSGELRWRYETGDAVLSSPTVMDGVVYVGSVDGSAYAVDEDGSNDADGSNVTQVDIANFELADLEVKVGTVVIWTNRHWTNHTLTHVADEGSSALFNSGTISPGAGFRWHFTEPGVFQYQCLIHSVNMKATVTVTE